MKTKLMGIVNVTPDSFYEKVRTQTVDAAVARALQLVAEGADYIDIGGESTRPGAELVSVQEECNRVLPVITALTQMTSIPLSIDTMKPEVAKRALQEGATIINDVTGFRDPLMRKLAKEYDAECIIMHMQGTPKTMQEHPTYPKGVVVEVMHFLKTQVELLQEEGIQKEKIIIDPGIGFGKTLEDNLALLKAAPQFRSLGCRTLYGISRKSFLKKLVNKPTEELLPATLAVNCYLALQCVEILRVHDVAAHRDALNVYSKIIEEGKL